ncbi:MAG: D-ribose pyranase [Rectinemataceae bacterium]|nr:D-ribose pyranase [Rectinemataceae bacterium]
MKKHGILNAALMLELTCLGHFDSFVICDIGFPIPKNARKIDLALTRGVPGFMQTLKAICGEVIVQSVTLMDTAPKSNPRLDTAVKAVFRRQDLVYASFGNFRDLAADAKFFIRTGEDSPCSNMLLVSASGAQSRIDQYDIPADELERLV